MLGGVLDNARHLARIDVGDMLGALYRFPEPLLAAGGLSKGRIAGQEPFENVILMGMGGSASAGDVLLDWLRNRIKVPAVVVREPWIPRFATGKTLVICFSYSGETFETLQGFELARKAGCGLAAVGSGGTLERLCGDRDAPFFQVESGLAPRAALSHMIVAGAAALQAARVMGNVRSELLNAGKELMKFREEFRPTVPSINNSAKRFARQLKGRVPVIYALQRMSCVARRFKNQLAENSKVMAKYDLFPESGHNEVEAWGKPGAHFVSILIRDGKETLEERACVQAFKAAIATVGERRPLEVKMRTHSSLAGFLSPILFLDYVSVYLGVLRGINPSQTPQIQNYKRKYRALN